jgi:hypothetical protein
MTIATSATCADADGFCRSPGSFHATVFLLAEHRTVVLEANSPEISGLLSDSRRREHVPTWSMTKHAQAGLERRLRGGKRVGGEEALGHDGRTGFNHHRLRSCGRGAEE